MPPKISGQQQGLLCEAHDYASQGQIADFVTLMTYEWGWAGGPPLAIAPINEVQRVLNYAITVIPRNKILMGIPLYGRDWKIPWMKRWLAIEMRFAWLQGTVLLSITTKPSISLFSIY